MIKLYVVIQKVTLLDGSEEFTYWAFMSIDFAETFMKYNISNAKKLGVKMKQYLDIWEVSKHECESIMNSARLKGNVLYKQNTLWGDDND